MNKIVRSLKQNEIEGTVTKKLKKIHLILLQIGVLSLRTAPCCESQYEQSCRGHFWEGKLDIASFDEILTRFCFLLH